jgi:hypothetical protein
MGDIAKAREGERNQSWSHHVCRAKKLSLQKGLESPLSAAREAVGSVKPVERKDDTAIAEHRHLHRLILSREYAEA